MLVTEIRKLQSLVNNENANENLIEVAKSLCKNVSLQIQNGAMGQDCAKEILQLLQNIGLSGSALGNIIYNDEFLQMVEEVVKNLSQTSVLENNDDICMLTEQMFDSINVLSELSAEGKTLYVGRFVELYLSTLLHTENSDFRHRLEILRSLNVLLEDTPSSVKEILLSRQWTTHYLKQLSDLFNKVGDYEFQVCIAECLFRLIPKKIRDIVVTNIFKDSTQRKDFLAIRDNEFETDCRIFLNQLNKTLKKTARVFSLACTKAWLGDKELFKPDDPNYKTFWVDFNAGSNRLTVFCGSFNGMSSQVSTEDLWETLTVWKDDVHSCIVKKIKKMKSVNILLAKTVSDIYPSQQDVSGRSVRLQFDINCNLEEALEMTFGSDRTGKKVSAASTPLVIQNADYNQEEFEDEDIPCTPVPSVCRRKVSVPDVPMSVLLSPACSVSSKVSESVSAVRINFSRTPSKTHDTVKMENKKVLQTPTAPRSKQKVKTPVVLVTPPSKSRNKPVESNSIKISSASMTKKIEHQAVKQTNSKKDSLPECLIQPAKGEVDSIPDSCPVHEHSAVSPETSKKNLSAAIGNLSEGTESNTNPVIPLDTEIGSEYSERVQERGNKITESCCPSETNKANELWEEALQDVESLENKFKTRPLSPEQLPNHIANGKKTSKLSNNIKKKGNTKDIKLSSDTDDFMILEAFPKPSSVKKPLSKNKSDVKDQCEKDAPENKLENENTSDISNKSDERSDKNKQKDTAALTRGSGSAKGLESTKNEGRSRKTSKLLESRDTKSANSKLNGRQRKTNNSINSQNSHPDLDMLENNIEIERTEETELQVEPGGRQRGSSKRRGKTSDTREIEVKVQDINGNKDGNKKPLKKGKKEQIKQNKKQKKEMDLDDDGVELIDINFNNETMEKDKQHNTVLGNTDPAAIERRDGQNNLKNNKPPKTGKQEQIKQNRKQNKEIDFDNDEVKSIDITFNNEIMEKDKQHNSDLGNSNSAAIEGGNKQNNSRNMPPKTGKQDQIKQNRKQKKEMDFDNCEVELKDINFNNKIKENDKQQNDGLANTDTAAVKRGKKLKQLDKQQGSVEGSDKIIEHGLHVKNEVSHQTINSRLKSNVEPQPKEKKTLKKHKENKPIIDLELNKKKSEKEKYLMESPNRNIGIDLYDFDDYALNVEDEKSERGKYEKKVLPEAEKGTIIKSNKKNKGSPIAKNRNNDDFEDFEKNVACSEEEKENDDEISTSYKFTAKKLPTLTKFISSGTDIENENSDMTIPCSLNVEDIPIENIQSTKSLSKQSKETCSSGKISSTKSKENKNPTYKRKSLIKKSDKENSLQHDSDVDNKIMKNASSTNCASVLKEKMNVLEFHFEDEDIDKIVPENCTEPVKTLTETNIMENRMLPKLPKTKTDGLSKIGKYSLRKHNKQKLKDAYKTTDSEDEISSIDSPDDDVIANERLQASPESDKQSWINSKKDKEQVKSYQNEPFENTNHWTVTQNRKFFHSNSSSQNHNSNRQNITTTAVQKINSSSCFGFDSQPDEHLPKNHQSSKSLLLLMTYSQSHGTLLPCEKGDAGSDPYDFDAECTRQRVNKFTKSSFVDNKNEKVCNVKANKQPNKKNSELSKSKFKSKDEKVRKSENRSVDFGSTYLDSPNDLPLFDFEAYCPQQKKKQSSNKNSKKQNKNSKCDKEVSTKRHKQKEKPLTITEPPVTSPIIKPGAISEVENVDNLYSPEFHDKQFSDPCEMITKKNNKRHRAVKPSFDDENKEAICDNEDEIMSDSHLSTIWNEKNRNKKKKNQGQREKKDTQFEELRKSDAKDPGSSILDNFSNMCKKIVNSCQDQEEENCSSKEMKTVEKKSKKTKNGNTSGSQTDRFVKTPVTPGNIGQLYKSDRSLKTPVTPANIRKLYKSLDISVIKTPKTPASVYSEGDQVDISGILSQKDFLIDSETEADRNEDIVQISPIKKQRKNQKTAQSKGKKERKEVDRNAEENKNTLSPSSAISKILSRSFASFNAELEDDNIVDEYPVSESPIELEILQKDESTRNTFRQKQKLKSGGFVSGPSTSLRPSRSSLKRKYSNMSVDSDNSEDEDSECDSYQQKCIKPRKLFRSVQQEHQTIVEEQFCSHETISDRSSEMFSDIDPTIEVSALLKAFGGDVQRHMQGKQSLLETVTKNVLKSTQKHMNLSWKLEQEKRSAVLNKYQHNMMKELQSLEKDISSLKEAEDNAMAFFKQQMKYLQQFREEQEKRLSNLHENQQDLEEEMNEIENQSANQHVMVKSKIKADMSSLQKKLLLESQKEELYHVKRNLQTIFF